MQTIIKIVSIVGAQGKFGNGSRRNTLVDVSLVNGDREAYRLTHCARLWITKQSTVAATIETGIGARLSGEITVTSSLRNMRLSAVKPWKEKSRRIPRYDQPSSVLAREMRQRYWGEPPS